MRRIRRHGKDYLLDTNVTVHSWGLPLMQNHWHPLLLFCSHIHSFTLSQGLKAKKVEIGDYCDTAYICLNVKSFLDTDVVRFTDYEGYIISAFEIFLRVIVYWISHLQRSLRD